MSLKEIRGSDNREPEVGVVEAIWSGQTENGEAGEKVTEISTQSRPLWCDEEGVVSKSTHRTDRRNELRTMQSSPGVDHRPCCQARDNDIVSCEIGCETPAALVRWSCCAAIVTLC